MTHTENSALQVANSILEKSFKKGELLLTHLKLQKILYILHGWHLAVRNQPAFYDLVEAWDYGPVVRSVYSEFKKYGDNFIEPSGPIGSTSVDASQFPEFGNVLDTVWERYKNHSSFELVFLTHEKGTPWDIARNEEQSDIIPNDLIKAYYKGLIKALDS